MDFSKKIKAQRLSIGATLEEIGNQVGVSKATVQRWESGEIKNLRRDKIDRLAKALHCTPAYLMGWEEENETRQTSQEMLQPVYYRLAMDAQNNDIDPEDLKNALDFVKSLSHKEKKEN